ncbi:MAG: molybdotransferase-like divisome protein Glp [Candidatus Nanopelagicales bacterium]
MRSVDEHQALALALAQPLTTVAMPLIDARGCVLAEDVTAAWPLPSFDNTSMDGYAVLAADLAKATADAPAVLRVVDDVPAGHRATLSVTPGTAIRIMTGALLPAGADAVVPVEWTDAGTQTVAIDRPVDAGAHIRRTGEDVAAGEIVLTAGTLLRSRHLAVVAASGRGEVLVNPRPRVAVISTGDELVAPGEDLVEGRIADSNGVMLAAAVLEAGGIPLRLGPIRDDADALSAALTDAAGQADLIVTSGGVSMGAYDTVKEVLSAAGGVEFVKVAMQPGMPQGLGRIEAVPIVTLPGNPVSSYVSFEMFVRPVIRRMRGLSDVRRPTLLAACGRAFGSPAGKTQFARVQLAAVDGLTVAYPEGAQGSHILGGLARADALAVVPADTTHVAEGEELLVLDLRRDG